MAESSYQQFELRTFYNLYARWPRESKGYVSGGKYVGLMQVPNGAGNAWNWLTNTQSASTTFQSKLSIATSWATTQKNNCGLTALSPQQLEDEALTLYGGFASNDSCGADDPYYWRVMCGAEVVDCSQPLNGGCSGSLQWGVTTLCNASVAYVNDTRGQTPLCP